MINLPFCMFTNCKYQHDCNCTNEEEYNKCEYRAFEQALKDIVYYEYGCHLYCTNSSFIEKEKSVCNYCKDLSHFNVDILKIIEEFHLFDYGEE